MMPVCGLDQACALKVSISDVWCIGRLVEHNPQAPGSVFIVKIICSLYRSGGGGTVWGCNDRCTNCRKPCVSAYSDNARSRRRVYILRWSGFRRRSLEIVCGPNLRQGGAKESTSNRRWPESPCVARGIFRLATCTARGGS